MSVPLTPWEQNPVWTPVATEAAFLESLDGVGGMSVAEIGRTVEDRAIWECRVGNPSGSTVLIVSGQHGPEPASREAAMKTVRNLAYRTDPWMDAYLAARQVIVIPTLNVDGRVYPVSRVNRNGVNTNRDWMAFTQPETQAVVATVVETDPDIIMDVHETSGLPGADWRPYPGGYPGEPSGVAALAAEFLDSSEPDMTSNGWTTLWYPHRSMAWGMLSTTASAAGRVGILSETGSKDIPDAQRVAISTVIMRNLLVWHDANVGRIQAARLQAATEAAGFGRVPLPAGEYVRDQTTTDAILYTLEESLPQNTLDYYGIQVGVGGVVDARQAARLIIAALADPASTEKIVSAEAVYLPNVVEGPRGVFGWVEHEGLRFPVKQIITQAGGVRFPVKRVVTQAAGVRFPVS